MKRLNLLHHLVSVLRFLVFLLTGRLGFPRERRGRVVCLGDGTRWVIFREAVIQRPTTPGATFLVRFHVANMTAEQNIRFSRIPIPFFVGLPGFRSKFWMYSPETGDFAGLYEWERVADAEAYGASFPVTFMTRRSAPGSVSYRVLPMSREEARAAGEWDWESPESAVTA
ncbi:MAG: hypothetical protein ACOY94_10725 [Bacillota bacterium]